MIEYSPKQLGFMLDKVLKAQKKEIEGPTRHEIKTEWLRNTTMALIDTLEKKTKEFNTQNPSMKIMADDLIGVVSATLNLLIKNSDVEFNKS